jgi:hypothetical protein
MSQKSGTAPHQRLKLLGDLHVQLDNTFIGLALAAILGSDREPTEILGVVENREQLCSGIDHHGDRVLC